MIYFSNWNKKVKTVKRESKKKKECKDTSKAQRIYQIKKILFSQELKLEKNNSIWILGKSRVWLDYGDGPIT